MKEKNRSVKTTRDYEAINQNGEANKTFKRVMFWFKSHLIISSIITIVIVLGIIVLPSVCRGFRSRNMISSEKHGQNDTDMICIFAYDDEEHGTFKLTYDRSGEKLKKFVLNHSEFMDNDDELKCNKYNTLPGISCSFDRATYPYTTIIEIMVDEIDEDSGLVLVEENLLDYLSYSKKEIKEAITRDNDDMFCFDVGEEKVRTAGYYVVKSGKYGYGSIRLYNSNRFSWISSIESDYGSGSFKRGNYKIDGNMLVFFDIETISGDGPLEYVKTDEEYRFEIVNGTTIRYDGYTYEWQFTSRFSKKQ